MTKEDKIRKINEYELLLKEINKNTTKSTFMLLLGILIIITNCFDKEDLSNDTLNYILSIFGSGLSVYYLKKMIENITKKVGIENLIELLELNIDDEHIKKLK